MACRPKGVFERRIDEVNSSPFRKSSTAWAVSACIASFALSACGGGGSESAAGASGLTLSGQAVKGPVSGGQVCAYTLQTPRQQIVCATTDSKSNYQLQLPAGTGEVLLEVTGGSYVDEATGKTVNLTTPLRTVTRAAAVLENVLLTPFTELAVQRAAAAHPAGQLSLVSFQSKINELEAGLGLSGLADGKPFGGNSTQDTNHQKALAAFAKLQAGHGKDVGGALQIMGSQLDQCGVNSLGITLAAYSAASTVGLNTTGSGSGSSTTGSGSGGGTVSIGSGGGLKLASLSSSTPSADIVIRGDQINISAPPSVCTDSFKLDGVAQPVADLFQTTTPSSWATAKQVNATLCGAMAGLNLNFPVAIINLSAGNLQTTGGVNVFGDLTSVDGAALRIGTEVAQVTLQTGSKLNVIGSSVSVAGGALSIDRGAAQIGLLTKSNVNAQDGIVSIIGGSLSFDRGSAPIKLQTTGTVMIQGTLASMVGNALTINSGAAPIKLETTGSLNLQGTAISIGGDVTVGPDPITPIPIVNANVTLGPGMSPINLASSGLIMNKGCYQSLSASSFANANIVVAP
jgi:hypothetical protein